MPPRFIAKQLSYPTGFLGYLIGKLMNRHNAKMNAFAIRQLELTPMDRVLEIGFGGGVTLPSLIDGTAFISGVDRSGDMVKRAKVKYAAAVMAGHADFRQGSVEALPYEAGTFGKIYIANSIYFWSSLDVGFSEIYRVLSPGGRVVIAFLPKDRMDRMGFPMDIFTSRAPGDVIAALAGAGFKNMRIERPEPATAWNVIVATR